MKAALVATATATAGARAATLGPSVHDFALKKKTIK